MKRFLLAGLAAQLFALPALAQSTTTDAVTTPGMRAPTTGAVAPPTTGTVTRPAAGSADSLSAGDSRSTRTGESPGANSFTESQARGRLEKNGYTQVSELKKDNEGIWRGSAMKDGTTVQVSVDYKGDISRN
jgi:hypothetical protein